MRRLAVVIGVLLASLAATVGAAGELSVTSDPAGAEVWVAPADQPGLYQKGLTPCTLTLSPSGRPYRLVLKHGGYFPVFRTVGDETAISVQLASRDDPASWQAAPSDAGRDGAPARQGVPHFTFSDTRWAADAAGLLMWGDAWGETVEELGLAKPDEDRELADLWYVPLHGSPVRLWRYLDPPGEQVGYKIDSDSSPDGRWVVHSAPTGDREHLELYCLITGRHRSIAAETQATLFCPVFSTDGRRIACLRISKAAEQAAADAEEGPPGAPGGPLAEVQVMQWNGCDRHTLLRGVFPHLAPAFSPDGTQLAFITAQRAVAVAPVKGGKARVVLSPESWVAEGTPVWSGDGTIITADFGRAEGRGPGGGGRPEVRRVFWARLDGAASGDIPAVTLHGWHDASSLDVYAPGYNAATGKPYQRLLWVGLDGKLKAVLRQEGESWFESLAPTIPFGGETR